MLAVAIALLAIQHVYIGARSEFLPCSLDCGESYEAYIGAVNLARLGLRYAAGLQDLAVGLRRQAHPMLYIHNPNLGVFFQYVVLRLGARPDHEGARIQGEKTAADGVGVGRRQERRVVPTLGHAFLQIDGVDLRGFSYDDLPPTHYNIGLTNGGSSLPSFAQATVST